MKPRHVQLRVFLLFALLSPAAVFAGSAPGIEELRGHVEYLASTGLEGRMTGTDGEKQAADYIVRQMQTFGARPLPESPGFVWPFEFTAGTRDIGSALTLTEGADPAEPHTWRGTERVRALSFSGNGTISGPVVFAGYGLTVPEGQEAAYDSYASLDVEGKIVLVLRYYPEDTEGDLRHTLSRYSGLRYKALQARDRGATGLIVVTGPRSPNAGKTIDMSFDAAIAGSGILAASIGGEVAERIFGVQGKNLEEVQRTFDTANPHVVGFEIPGLSLTLEVQVERERRTGRNVIGYLPATETGGQDRQFVILGAHYDHLGRGKHGNSLADKDEAGQVHPGADDNASGVAAVLAAGARLASSPRRRPVMLAFWSGEEIGLLGSTDFVDEGGLDAERIAAYLNFDMVGRMRENRLNLQAAGSSSVWPGLIERANVPVGFDVRTQSDPYLPTDASVLYRHGVPSLAFFTGSHEDYHRPTDMPELVNYEDLARVARFAALLAGKIARLDQAPDYVEVKRTSETSGQRDNLRTFTGTIPDYATEVEGLRLSGVVAGGPADEAGLREGDVIVELAGRKIANIYDYTYALEAVKVDQPAKVVILRDGKRHELVITPTSRP